MTNVLTQALANPLMQDPATAYLQDPTEFHAPPGTPGWTPPAYPSFTSDQYNALMDRDPSTKNSTYRESAGTTQAGGPLQYPSYVKEYYLNPEHSMATTVDPVGGTVGGAPNVNSYPQDPVLQNAWQKWQALPRAAIPTPASTYTSDQYSALVRQLQGSHAKAMSSAVSPQISQQDRDRGFDVV
jgi:hypothetical protein